MVDHSNVPVDHISLSRQFSFRKNEYKMQRYFPRKTSLSIKQLLKSSTSLRLQTKTSSLYQSSSSLSHNAIHLQRRCSLRSRRRRISCPLPQRRVCFPIFFNWQKVSSRVNQRHYQKPCPKPCQKHPAAAQDVCLAKPIKSISNGQVARLHTYHSSHRNC